MLTARSVGVPLVFLLASLPAPGQTPEPEYDGKKASEWVKVVQSDSSARKRAIAVSALGRLWTDHRYKDALPNLGKALRADPSAAVRVQAAAVIGTLGPDDAKALATDLIDALKGEKESRVKREIALALGRFPEVAKNAVAPLADTLKDADPGARAAAADTLGRVGADAKAAAPELLPLLNDTDKAVRQAAVFALGRISPENPSFVAAALIKVLETEKDGDLRRELIVSLGLLGDRSETVVKALAAGLADPDDELRRTAVRTLGTFGTAAGPAADALLKVAAADKDKGIRVDAVRAFGSALGSAALKIRVGELVKLLDDPDFEVRIAVLDEIGALGNEILADKDTVAAVRKRLSDPQVKVREAAAAALRRIERKPEKPPEKKP